jgi:hypothetical protein
MMVTRSSAIIESAASLSACTVLSTALLIPIASAASRARTDNLSTASAIEIESITLLADCKLRVISSARASESDAKRWMTPMVAFTTSANDRLSVVDLISPTIRIEVSVSPIESEADRTRENIVVTTSDELTASVVALIRPADREARSVRPIASDTVLRITLIPSAVSEKLIESDMFLARETVLDDISANERPSVIDLMKAEDLDTESAIPIASDMLLNPEDIRAIASDRLKASVTVRRMIFEEDATSPKEIESLRLRTNAPIREGTSLNARESIAPLPSAIALVTTSLGDNASTADLEKVTIRVVTSPCATASAVALINIPMRDIDSERVRLSVVVLVRLEDAPLKVATTPAQSTLALTVAVVLAVPVAETILATPSPVFREEVGPPVEVAEPKDANELL